MDDWQRNALKAGLIGGGTGAAASLVLNAIYHMRNRSKPANELVPNSIIERPYFVDPDQAELLEAQGMSVRPSYGLSKAACEALYAQGSSITAVLERAGHPLSKTAANPLVEGFKNVALPVLSGLGAGYAGFRGVDYLLDGMAKDTAKSRYEKKRKELESLMAELHGGQGLQKIAEDYINGGTLVHSMPILIKRASDELQKVAIFGLEKAVGAVGSSVADSSGGFLEGLSGWGVALPFALASMVAFPKAVKAFRESNPNTQQLDDIEEHYRSMPESSRIKLVPTLRRPAVKKPGAEEDELQKVAADATAVGGATASTVAPNLVPKVPEPSLAAPSGQFNGRFSLSEKSGFTRHGPGNMPMPKDSAKRTPSTMGSISNAVA